MCDPLQWAESHDQPGRNIESPQSEARLAEESAKTNWLFFLQRCPGSSDQTGAGRVCRLSNALWATRGQS